MEEAQKYSDMAIETLGEKKLASTTNFTPAQEVRRKGSGAIRVCRARLKSVRVHTGQREEPSSIFKKICTG